MLAVKKIYINLLIFTQVGAFGDISSDNHCTWNKCDNIPPCPLHSFSNAARVILWCRKVSHQSTYHQSSGVGASAKPPREQCCACSKPRVLFRSNDPTSEWDSSKNNRNFSTADGLNSNYLI